MTKIELQEKLEIPSEKLNEVLKACGYTNEDEFNQNHLKTIKAYMKKLNIIPNIKVNNDLQPIDKDKLIVAPRKEIMQLLSIAYEKGYQKGLNSIPVAGEYELQCLLDEVLKESA